MSQIAADEWQPGLAGTGPLPANVAEVQFEAHAQGKREFECENLVALRAIPTHHLNWRAVLFGEVLAFDGNLQGFYYFREGDDADNEGSIIRPDDFETYRRQTGRSYVWKKLNP